MLFNSLHFLLFFPLVVIAHFVVPQRFRWLLLLLASYYFYMCWRPEYALLILGSTTISWLSGLLMAGASTPGRRRLWLVVGVAANVAPLFLFKYFNFFNDSARAVATALQLPYAVPTLHLILPVGISFFTFQTMSYTIDLYRGQCPLERHFGIFALYVSFFPQLVAGPIERSTNLLPQFRERRVFDDARVTSGLQLMLWGFFKKVAIADNVAEAVNAVYNDVGHHQGPTLLLATVLFAFQIYCDFSGYSDIAIGAAQVLGFRLMQNFRCPYHARSIGEFWHRWHISLSTWFRDYVYIPLGGNRVPRARWYGNLFVTFVISGLWHGANWTFVIWGSLHGAYLLAGLITGGLRRRLVTLSGLARVPRLHGVLQQAVTFALVCFAWVFFRANSMADAWYVITHLATGWQPDGSGLGTWLANVLSAVRLSTQRGVVIVGLLLLLESVQALQARGSVRDLLNRRPVWVRWPAYYALLAAIVFLGAFNRGQQFIYFQF